MREIAQDILLESGLAVSAPHIKKQLSVLLKNCFRFRQKKEDEKSLRDFYYSRNEKFFEELGLFKSRTLLAKQLYARIKKSQKKWQVSQDFVTYSKFLRKNDVKIGIISNYDKSFPAL